MNDGPGDEGPEAADGPAADDPQPDGGRSGDPGGANPTNPDPVAATVEDYYEALRRGEPLYPYFDESPATAKVGIGETLQGYGATAEALREQNRVTDDWTVESHRLRAGRRGEAGWFSDLVGMGWTHGDDRHSFDTRWTGAVVERGEEWVFVELHVSVAHDPATGELAGFGTNVDDPGAGTPEDPGTGDPGSEDP